MRALDGEEQKDVVSRKTTTHLTPPTSFKYCNQGCLKRNSRIRMVMEGCAEIGVYVCMCVCVCVCCVCVCVCVLCVCVCACVWSPTPNTQTVFSVSPCHTEQRFFTQTLHPHTTHTHTTSPPHHTNIHTHTHTLSLSHVTHPLESKAARCVLDNRVFGELKDLGGFAVCRDDHLLKLIFCVVDAELAAACETRHD